MLISTVGVDEIYGVDRFTFGVRHARATASVTSPVMVGAYGLGEVLVAPGAGIRLARRCPATARIETRIPTSRRGLEAAG